MWPCVSIRIVISYIIYLSPIELSLICLHLPVIIIISIQSIMHIDLSII